MEIMCIRSYLRSRILDSLGFFSKPAVGVHILNGHRMFDSNETTDTFRSLLSTISSYVSFVNFEDAVKLIVHKEVVDRPIVAFSFDDGFSECYTHFAPVLEDFGVNAAFFINPNFVDGDSNYIENFTEKIVRTPDKSPMSWSQIKDLSDRGHIIGAHTMDHYLINDDNIGELTYQIGECKNVLFEKLGEECEYFAFPYGRLEHANLKSIEIACDFYKYVFSQSDYKNYYSFNGRVINRRHFEPFWPINHVKYFLSCVKK